MYAFGDSVLFLGVLGVAAIPATGTALFFLRPRQGFWRTRAARVCWVVASAIEVVSFAAVAFIWFTSPR